MNERLLPEFERKILGEMSTDILYSLSGECVQLEKKIKAELILRGDF